jgi:exopolysaccharide biosynthesis polyprenyl glycosylphosphotransferase
MLARRAAAALSAPERVLVLGNAPAALSLRERAEDRLRVKFVAAVGLEEVQEGDDLPEIIDHFDVDRVIIAPPSTASAPLVPELVRAAKAAGVRVSVLPGVLHVVGSQVEFDDVFGVTLLGVRRFGLTRSSRALKRSFDVLAVLLTSAVTVPLLAICAILIRLDTRGPVFFRQERVGLYGRRFQMIKLRTMVDGAEALKSELSDRNEVADGSMFKIAEDPRVTRVGRGLRRVHIDELPQLVNVLLGRMSIVGPRPLILDEDDQIKGLDRRRLELTPGITGPWQILGTRRRVPMAEMLKLDYVYAANWSLWNDTKILLRTVATVMTRRGV